MAIGIDQREEAAGTTSWWGVAGYAAMLTATVGLFFAIRHFGETYLTAGGATSIVPLAEPQSPSAKPVDVVFHVLVTLAGVILLGHGLGRAMAWIGQPPVIGEVVAGIVLGPSVLGAISPAAMHFFLPDKLADPSGLVVSALKAISQLGIVLYMFLVGLELNAARIAHKTHAAIAISHASIVAPFLLGAALALWIFPLLAPQGVPFTSFALFMGVSMAVTAFPVLARILTDRGLDKTEIGVMALTCAAADDVTAWCLLAFVVGVAQAQVGGALLVGAGAAVFIALMFFLIRPLATRAAAALEDQPISPTVVLLALAAVLVSALITEAIGIHAVFGAFLLGVMIPHDSRLASELTTRLKDVTTILLLPAFFAVTGMRTKIGLMAGGWEWLITGAVVLVAIAGKLGGTALAARACGEDWRTSLGLGWLMNTRGLMGLIVLNIGLDLGVISETLFTMMVLMALVTTMATSPALSLLGIEPEPKQADLPRSDAVAA